jgi:hypothetical protein
MPSGNFLKKIQGNGNGGHDVVIFAVVSTIARRTPAVTTCR